MQDLKNKVDYITGGSKGIGFGVAKKLIGAGMKVAISGRTLKTVQQAADYLGRENNVMGLASNVSLYDDEKRAIEQILEKWGQLDVVFANAGVGHFMPVDEMSTEHWNQMIDTNLTGVFLTLKASVEARRNRRDIT